MTTLPSLVLFKNAVPGEYPGSAITMGNWKHVALWLNEHVKAYGEYGHDKDDDDKD